MYFRLYIHLRVKYLKRFDDNIINIQNIFLNSLTNSFINISILQIRNELENLAMEIRCFDKNNSYKLRTKDHLSSHYHLISQDISAQ